MDIESNDVVLQYNLSQFYQKVFWCNYVYYFWISIIAVSALYLAFNLPVFPLL